MKCELIQIETIHTKYVKTRHRMQTCFGKPSFMDGQALSTALPHYKAEARPQQLVVI